MKTGRPRLFWTESLPLVISRSARRKLRWKFRLDICIWFMTGRNSPRKALVLRSQESEPQENGIITARPTEEAILAEPQGLWMRWTEAVKSNLDYCPWTAGRYWMIPVPCCWMKTAGSFSGTRKRQISISSDTDRTVWDV